jgi:hypothetical protein
MTSVNETVVFNGRSITGANKISVGASTLPATTLQATGTTTLIGNVFVNGGALYPPGPMTSASTLITGRAYGNGTYTSFGSEIAGYSASWYSFDQSLTTLTEIVNVYSGSSPFAYSNTAPYAFSNTVDVTSTTYNGAWIQLQVPSAIVLEYYTIFPAAGAEIARPPGTFRIFGSTTGASGTWVSIDARSGISWSAPQVSQTFYLSPLPTAYSYFRLSVQNLSGNGGLLDVSQWNLYSSPPVPAMSILGGDLIIASGGSLVVQANAYISNAVTTTNVFAATEILTGTTGATTLNVTGNLYVSNAVTTTNLFTAGITSNAVSTVFNSDTLTIPFVYSTTLNVASTSNLDTVTLTGEPGLTTVFASGNAYVSNALTTTNVFASDVILASSTLGTVVAGQMEYNTYLYGTINTTSGRGSVPIDYIYRLTTPTAAYGIASNNFFTGTATGTGARLNLEASSVYDIEAYCLFTKTTDGTVTWILATSSAPTLITAAYTASPTAGISGGAPVTSYVGGVTTTVTFQTTGTLTGGFSHSFLFKIQVLTNLATTFGITATQSAGTMTSLAGSYYRVTKLSTTTGAFT